MPARHRPVTDPLSQKDVFPSSVAQRRSIQALYLRNATLRTRGMLLRTEMQSLSQDLQQSLLKLIANYIALRSTTAAVTRRSHPAGDRPVGRPIVERTVAVEPELLDALLGATEILRAEFAGTDGAGRETLARCEKALCKARVPIRSIELPLY